MRFPILYPFGAAWLARPSLTVGLGVVESVLRDEHIVA
jgi:hypothetical protein